MHPFEQLSSSCEGGVVIIRDAVPADVPAIAGLYNALIPTTTVAWTEEIQTVDQRQAWFDKQVSERFPVVVAEVNGEVVGFCAYGHFRGAGMWPGYSTTAEHTIHVAEAYWGTGVGRALLEELTTRAKSADIHVLVGAVDGANTASIEFHARLGFVEVARMPQVGHKFGRWLDLVLMQRILDERPTP
jgi:L-amino acid N-acyltransferase